MDRYVTHATVSLERSYPVPAARVFAAWPDPAAKARWFAPGPDSGHQLDFRVGGREVNHGGPEIGPVLSFESFYRDIVPDERIVYSSTGRNRTGASAVPPPGSTPSAPNSAPPTRGRLTDARTSDRTRPALQRSRCGGRRGGWDPPG